MDQHWSHRWSTTPEQKSTGGKADLSTKLATCMKSSSVKPLEVRAGAPMRTPPGIRADVSPAQLPHTVNTMLKG